MADTVAPLVDLYDHEILAAEKVLHKLYEKIGKSTNLEAFRVEAIERFQDIGLVVDVKVWDAIDQRTGEKVYQFDVEPIGRTEAIEWDPDQQVHEVRTDILELLPPGERGEWIKTKVPEEQPKHGH